MPDQRPQPAPAGDRDDHDGEHRGEGDQRPGPLVVEERVAGRARRIDLAADADVVADGEVGLAGPAAELEQRVGALVRAGVDGDQGLHALATALRSLHWIGGQHRARRGAPARRGLAGQHVPGLGGDRTAGRVLEWQRDVDLLLAGPQPHRAGEHGDADGDQQSDDDLGGHRAQRRGTGGVRVGMRVRHPQQGRGRYWPATAGRTPGSCPAARSRWPGRGPTAASRCAGDPASAS